MKKIPFILFVLLLVIAVGNTMSHPLGVLSTNRYARLEIASDKIRVVYVLDVAEIPAIQELVQIDTDGNGVISEKERTSYMEKKEKEVFQNLRMTVDGSSIQLKAAEQSLEFLEGQGGLHTVRFSAVYEGPLLPSDNVRTLGFSDLSSLALRGWREIVARGTDGQVITKTTASEIDITDALHHYPQDKLDTPPLMTGAEVSFRHSPESAENSVVSMAQSAIHGASDRFAALVTHGELDLTTILASMLFALFLGAGHALTPGHGKTIVAAYLVGSRGTATDALILGLTVTATHTAGVFALGLIALFASQYILPADLFPWLGLLSGLIVIWIGISLLCRRLKHAIIHGDQPHGGEHHHGDHVHSHGGTPHSHTFPPADASARSIRRLVALGVSGGLLPCPSAIVVLLGAIALGRVGFGILLVFAFGLGLAGVLTALGLIMVASRKLFARIPTQHLLLRWLPVLSAAVITIAGVLIAVQAGKQIPLSRTFEFTGSISLLGLGFVLGLKHALDADHLVAVSTIVSEHKGLFSSSIVGGLWGLGHTASLLFAGLVVVALHISIPEKLAQALEFSVAAMLIVLGINVLRKAWKGGVLHMHSHTHDGFVHVHPQTHPGSHDHLGLRGYLARGKRSVLIGMVHGLAGSAALMLLVLATIPSASLALLYIGVFGLGSVGGMLVMSTLIGLPFTLSLRTSASLHRVVRAASGLVSVGFGLMLAWQIGVVGGLFL